MARMGSRIGGLVLISLLSGCGSSEPLSMKVTCSGGTSVQPLNRLIVQQVPAIGGKPPTATLNYRDPLHTDQIGTITMGPGERCTVEPASKT